jgi:hypothetical protein
VTVPLLVRFPKLRAPSVSQPVIPPDSRAAYPEFATDFAVLDREVAPVFAEYDKAALRGQNRYRRQQVLHEFLKLVERLIQQHSGIGWHSDLRTRANDDTVAPNIANIDVPTASPLRDRACLNGPGIVAVDSGIVTRHVHTFRFGSTA